MTIPRRFRQLLDRDDRRSQVREHPSKSVTPLQPGATVEPHDNILQVDSTAQVGPIGASMLLFLIDRESAEQRPVELTIDGEDGPATFDLDL